MSEELVFAFGRVAERLFIVIIAGVSIWLGWKLFLLRAKQSEQVAEFTWKDFAIKFQKVAPGIFFALFGASILAIALWKNLTIPTHVKAEVPGLTSASAISYLDRARPSLKELQALNLAVELAKIPPAQAIADADRQSLSAKASDLEVARNRLIIIFAGPQKFDAWTKVRTAPDSASSTDRQVHEEVDQLMHNRGL